MSGCAMASTEQVGAVSANDEAPADLGDHCAHVCAFNRHGERTKLSAHCERRPVCGLCIA